MLDTITETQTTLAQIPAKISFVAAPRYPLGKTVKEADEEAKSATDYLQELQVIYREYESLQQKANVALYRFLEGVFVVMARMHMLQSASKKEAKSMRTSFEIMMDDRRDQGLVTFTSATSLETKILRFVCGNITPAREKAWVRVLKVAMKNEDILSGKISFAAWLAGKGGVYEVAHTNNEGIKPSEQAKAQVAAAQKLIEEWHGTGFLDDVNSNVLRNLKNDDKLFENFTVTLNCYDGENAKQVIELCDPISIQRILLLMGKQINEPVRSKEEVQAEQEDALREFDEACGRDDKRSQ